ncbi:MAG TPA: Ada metal-binding domain-containing protein [Fibrobacteria bacterium]|nr:Ada metal-binding domain-containing protein [Fibrobacteria bacterium]
MQKEDTWYRAMLARDFRFDGKFYVGVKTTGVYCRPICPARPKRENVEFFSSALLAEKKGYRPCLRCRPETAPQSPAWSGKSALVQRALKAISEQEHADLDEETFAERFGVGSRHLRRLFAEEMGKTPKRIILENRLNFARTLIVDTGIPIGEIAFASGFSSVRRFNDAIKDRFKRPPSLLRKRSPGAPRDQGITLTLPFRPPFDFEASLAYYRSHAIAGLESFADGAYERIFHWGGKPGIVRVTLHGKGRSLSLQVIGGETGALGRVAQSVRRMFDLDSDPVLIANAFSGNPHLDRLYRGGPGLRSPRGWDPFETAVCSILGQLVSMEQANRMISQLVEGYGEAVRHPLTGADLRVFPGPERLATSALDKVGTTGARKETIREFSRRLVSGTLSLGSAQDPEAFRKALLDVKGIGPWTAEYISLRCIADTDAFPGTDLILKRVLERHPDIDLECARPWRGYAAAYLWRAYAGEFSNKTKTRGKGAVL